MRRRTLCAASALAMMTPIPVSAFSFAEDEFDVVVAGAGGAGLAAALSAAEQGASVLLVEKMAAIGGNTLRASGLFNASDPARQEPMGITDSPSWHYEQTMASGHGRNDPAVVRRFVCEALPTLKWLESLGVRFMPETVATWGAEWPRGHKPTQPRGQAYIRTLSSECIRRGVKIRTRCAMTRLLMKNGRAASIEVEDLSSGRGKDKMVFHARKAVILTAGGFAANPELVESYRADLAGIPTDNNPGSTGEVMLEAIRAGAASNALECIQCVPGAPEGRGFQVRLDLDVGRVLMVDGGGRRFIDEDGSRDGLAKAILDGDRRWRGQSHGSFQQKGRLQRVADGRRAPCRFLGRIGSADGCRCRCAQGQCPCFQRRSRHGRRQVRACTLLAAVGAALLGVKSRPQYSHDDGRTRHYA